MGRATWDDHLRHRTGSGRGFWTPLAYIDMADGDVLTGILLSQLVYWHQMVMEHGPTRSTVIRDGYEWICKKRTEWKREIRLTERQIERSIGVLVGLGLVEKRTWQSDGVPTQHLRVVGERFMDVYERAVDALLAEERDGQPQSATSPLTSDSRSDGNPQGTQDP